MMRSGWLLLFVRQNVRQITSVFYGVGCTSGFQLVSGYAKSHRSRDHRANRAALGNDLKGEPNTACLADARQTWGLSRAQGYKLIKQAWQQIKLDIDESGIDRQELLSWSIQTLMAAAGQAMQQKNSGAVVSAIRQLDHMTGIGYSCHRGYGMRR